MPGELLGIAAAPVIFGGLVGLGVLLTIVVRRLLYEPTRRNGSVDVQPARPEDCGDARPAADDESRLPKII